MVCLSVCLSVGPSVRLSVHLCVHLSVCPCVCPYVRMSVFPTVHMYVCPYARLSGSPYVCLHVCSYVRMRGGVSTIRPGKDGIAATSSRMLVVFAAETEAWGRETQSERKISSRSAPKCDRGRGGSRNQPNLARRRPHRGEIVTEVGPICG